VACWRLAAALILVTPCFGSISTPFRSEYHSLTCFVEKWPVVRTKRTGSRFRLAQGHDHSTHETASSSTLSPGYTRTSKTWQFREQYPIAYEIVESKQRSTPTIPVLLLNGFGVGSFHQHLLMDALFQTVDHKHELVVYGMDYLGQGYSWPADCQDGFSDSERGLRYCGNTWQEQVISFIEQVIHDKVHLVGNSVGGYLAVHVAAARPDLVQSIVLLNATPVWGGALDRFSPWTGHLPAPAIPRWIGRVLFDQIRNPDTIKSYLQAAYSQSQSTTSPAIDQVLIEQIRACTQVTNGGHAAFASILWSPAISTTSSKSTTITSYKQALEHVNCDVLLIYGQDDPWCKPAIAQATLRVLRENSLHSEGRQAYRYVELSNVGHCPNHEAPNAVASIFHRWIEFRSQGSTQSNVSLLLNDEGCAKESITAPLGSTQSNVSLLLNDESCAKESITAPLVSKVFQERWGETTAYEYPDGRYPQVSWIDEQITKLLF
jgi:pimeloyl-ACP methyl ester carboxylesterase